jgi:excisionase family DNA binding protein
MTGNDQHRHIDHDVDQRDDQCAGEFDDLRTLREVAELLRIPEATLRYWIHKGIGPDHLKIGRHIRYPHAALTHWLREQRRSGGSSDAA